MCMILQHPKAPVHFDLPEPLPPDAAIDRLESINRAQKAAIEELHAVVRVLLSKPRDTVDACIRQDGLAAVTILVDRFGAADVSRWTRNLAAITGEAI